MEMFPRTATASTSRHRLLHACGDVARHQAEHTGPHGFAPRMWRCFQVEAQDIQAPAVCSTHVEMFPRHRATSSMRSRLLHACGDVSEPPFMINSQGLFAPRMWRCFLMAFQRGDLITVCSTHVEMFPCLGVFCAVLARLLHACGDVSGEPVCPPGIVTFAPRMWRRCCILNSEKWIISPKIQDYIST